MMILISTDGRVFRSTSGGGGGGGGGCPSLCATNLHSV